MELISVIVPVYKVEKYLNKCVESIVNQTYKNLEIILVDDGSPDNCPAMCDSWAEKDARIKVVHKPNGGLSDARNAGMAVATGEYIAFVDSDDWVDVDMYCRLYDAIKNEDADIATCGARRVWEDGQSPRELRAVNIDCVLEREKAVEAFITSNGLVQTVWNKLYRRNMVANILFRKGTLYEDEFWTWQAFVKAKRIVTLKESFYNYLQRSDSIMGAGFTKQSIVVIHAKIERQDYIENNLPALTDVGRADLAYSCMHKGIGFLVSMPRKEAKTYIKYLKSVIKKYPISKTHLQKLPRNKRVHLRMIRHFFVLTCRMHGLKIKI